MSRLRIGELFAGYGGLGMGVKAALGGEVRWVSDIDKGANRVLAHRFPDVPNLGDISTIDWADVEPVDVLTGGFPCQDLSTAGKRAGLRPGTRSGLWEHFAYAINQLRPSLVVIENVRGLLSASANSDLEPCPWCLGDRSDGHLRALGAVLGDLAELGYDASWVGLRAADVGAPHGRFRVFVVAYPQSNAGRVIDGDGGAAADAGRLRLGAGWPTGPGEAEGWRALGDVAGRGVCACGVGDDPDWTPPSDIPHEPGCPAQDASLRRPAGWPSDAVPALRPGHGDGPALADRAQQLLPTSRATDGTKGGPNQRGSSGDLMLPSAVMGLLPTPTARDWKNAGDPEKTAARMAERRQPLTEIACNAHWGDYAAAVARWETAIGRPAPAPTMTSAKGNPQLSPAFTEWMMGLPPGWITDVPGVTRNEALKLCGNGVVWQQAEAAVRWLLRVQAVAA